ncbi:MAG: SDR family oxidoreductase [bacterium]
MILVVGATGLLGMEVCRRLRARGLPVRALVRASSPREAMLLELGAEIARGDLRDRASLEAACAAVDTIITTATAMGSKDKTITLRTVDLEGQLRLVDVARANGVRRYVYLSASPNLRPTVPLVRYKREVEHAIRASGMQWTIVQPSVLMDVWLSSLLGWDLVAGRAMVFGAGTAPLSWITVSDVAEHVVRGLDDPRCMNRDLPLGGPDAISPNAVVQLFESVSGRPYRVRRVPRQLLALMAPLLAMFDEGIASGMGMGAQTTRGDVIDSPIQREIGLPLTSVRAYVERALTK